MKKRVAIIGCGNLGIAILNGLLESKFTPADHITVTRRNLEQLQDYSKEGVNLTSDNRKAIQDSEIILVALKPHNILSIMGEVKDAFDPEKHVVVSLATGITISELSEVVGDSTPLFRAMPNTAAYVSESLTCICSNHHGTGHTEEVKELFSGIGAIEVIEEDLMEAATVLGACGIAFVLRFMRAMVQGGIQIGFSSQVANRIVNQTVNGASKLLIENNAHPEEEIDKVTTPKGCTIEGLNEMEHFGFSSALIKGIVTSFEKIEK